MSRETEAGQSVRAIFNKHPNRALSNREIFEIAAVTEPLDTDDISLGLKLLRRQKLITVSPESEKDGKYSRYRLVR